MKTSFRSFAAVCFAALTLTACKKDVKESNVQEVPESTLAQIAKMGFRTEGVQKVEGGFLVENDILLSNSQLGVEATSPNMVVAQEEQYRTFNLVSATKHPTINIALNSTSAAHDAVFTAAIDETIRRYNAEGLTIRFARVDNSQAHDITIKAYYQVSNTLGYAGFPNSTGDPFNEVQMNTYHYSNSTSATNVNYIATIIAHEVGHCIGFRHTDYMKRSYSCGGRPAAEGEVTTGVGAVHIPGTPTGGDPNSWMLACSNGTNRPFNANDKIALSYLY